MTDMHSRPGGARRTARSACVAGKLPDARGRFGPFGGRYVPETLIPALERLEAGLRRFLPDAGLPGASSAAELHELGGPAHRADATRRRSAARWGAEVWLKREDLAHTGAHKINNALGQALLAQRLGAKRIIAETGAGQHGVATAAACARVGLPCIVYMGAVDMRAPGAERRPHAAAGREVVPVTSGDRTLRAAIDEAFRDWVSDPVGTLLPARLRRRPASLSVAGARAAVRHRPRGARAVAASAPAACRTRCSPASAAAPTPSACSTPFVGDPPVEIIGVEAGGRGAGLGDNAATLATGRPGVLHGTYSMLLQDAQGQIQETALDLRGPRLSRRRARSTRCCGRSAA